MESQNGDYHNASFQKYRFCSDRIPTTRELFNYLPLEGYILAGILTLFTALTIAIYIEEVIFIARKFPHPGRTIWLLACFPVFSMTGLLGVFVPRAGTLVDLIANGFFATCMYNFGCLITSYMGGTKRMWNILDSNRQVEFKVLPCCCFGMICFRQVTLHRSVYRRVQALYLQIIIVRPVLALFAVVLWANGNYRPGEISITNAQTYLSLLNILSTMTAMYGLMIQRKTFLPDLGKQYSLSGKILTVQTTLFSTIIPIIIINMLVSSGVISCGPMFPSKARGEEIYHGVLVLLMLPYSLLGQRFFRRASDAVSCDQRQRMVIKDTSCSSNGHASPITTADDDGYKAWMMVNETNV